MVEVVSSASELRQAAAKVQTHVRIIVAGTTGDVRRLLEGTTRSVSRSRAVLGARATADQHGTAINEVQRSGALEHEI